MLNTALIFLTISAVYFSHDMTPRSRTMAGIAYLTLGAAAFVAHVIK